MVELNETNFICWNGALFAPVHVELRVRAVREIVCGRCLDDVMKSVWAGRQSCRNASFEEALATERCDKEVTDQEKMAEMQVEDAPF